MNGCADHEHSCELCLANALIFLEKCSHTHGAQASCMCCCSSFGGISYEWQSISWLTNIYPLPSNCQLYQIVTLLLHNDAIHLCPLPHHSCDLLHLRSCGAVGCAAADLGTPLQ
jgi:hypothetical protein